MKQQDTKHLGSPFSGPSSKPWLVPASSGIIALIALTVTVFFRREFGRRVLNPPRLCKAAVCFAAYLVAMRFYAGRGAFVPTAPVPVGSLLTWLAFVLMFFCYTSWQLFTSVSRRHMLPDEYSQSDGRPWPRLMKLMPFVHDEWDFERYYEPGICIAVGLVLLLFHNWFGLYILIAGLCAGNVASTKQNTRIALDLSVLDGRISSTTQPRFDNPLTTATKPISIRPTERKENT